MSDCGGGREAGGGGWGVGLVHGENTNASASLWPDRGKNACGPAGALFARKGIIDFPRAFLTELSPLNYHRERYALHRREGKNCILNGLYLQQ